MIALQSPSTIRKVPPLYYFCSRFGFPAIAKQSKGERRGSGGESEKKIRKQSMENAIKKVRYMRRNPTEAEAIFWELVRGRKICGKNFIVNFP